MEMDVPPLFRCPISLELLKDPVTLCTGQTYERFCIEKWIAAGNITCPVTMQELQDLSMVPNHALRRLIDEWLRCNAVEDLGESSEYNMATIAEFKQILESGTSAFEDTIKVLEKVRSLCLELPAKNSVLIDMGFFEHLLGLVFRDSDTFSSQKNFILIEKSLDCALLLLPFSDIASPNGLKKQECKFKRFLFLFEQGTISIKRTLCHFVEAIVFHSETQDLFQMLSDSPSLIHQIVALIHEESGAIEAGILAVSALSSLQRNRQVIVDQGAVEKLTDYLAKVGEQNRSHLAPVVMETIENLLTVSGVKEMIIDHKFGIRSIVNMVFRISDHQGSESALNSLLIICSDSNVPRQKAVVNGILPQLLLVLQSQCSGGAKIKAKMLLKLLRLMWNEEALVLHPINR